MKLDLAGKIKNTQLPRSKALFPMFEAVVNSFQAIEDMNAPGSPGGMACRRLSSLHPV